MTENPIPEEIKRRFEGRTFPAAYPELVNELAGRIAALERVLLQKEAELAALCAAEAAMKQANDRGWYCPTCDRAVDPRHVTHTEHHDACGTFIGLAARTPKAQEGK